MPNQIKKALQRSSPFHTLHLLVDAVEKETIFNRASSDDLPAESPFQTKSDEFSLRVCNAKPISFRPQPNTSRKAHSKTDYDSWVTEHTHARTHTHLK